MLPMPPPIKLTAAATNLFVTVSFMFGAQRHNQRRAREMASKNVKAAFARPLHLKLGVLALHSITKTACLTMESGIVTPRAFAALRFTDMSNSFGPSTGRSAVLAPLTILSTNPAVRR